MKIKKGIYLHYKGKRYEVLGTVFHSETVEELVLYKPLYPFSSLPKEKQQELEGKGYKGEGAGLWVRPIDIFLEEIEVDGKKVPRFKYAGE
ncbi:DUF1653 domain-containing protein [Candidatus Falkowbacteria bacterium]|nr:DUF1653 domain-containing protein [Candidatus Falkowbacteria bacterium]